MICALYTEGTHDFIFIFHIVCLDTFITKRIAMWVYGLYLPQRNFYLTDFVRKCLAQDTRNFRTHRK